MEPQIRYAKTSDGVSIAYWTLGEGGTPLIILPPRVYSHIGLEWEKPELQSWYERLAERRMIVRYDPRGNGLSDRNVADFSLEAAVHDLQAVVDRLSLPRFALIGFGGSTPLVMAYAAQFPDRITRLMLSTPMARAADAWDHPAFKEVLPLLDKDWRLFTETLAHVILGWDRGRAAHDWARFMRRAVTQDDYRGMVGVQTDAAQFLDRVQAPTLILHSRRFPVELASGIANARLVQIDVDFYLDPISIRSIDEFLADGDEAPASERTDNLPSGTATILFADIVDSTALTERLGDTVFREKARELDSALREIIRGRSGTPIEGKLLGDGVLATFASAKDAIDASMEIARCGNEAGLPLHVGLHAGDVIREDDADGRGNVFGGTVNIASRISGLAAPGEVLVSQTVRDLARTSAGVSFEDRRERELKGVSEPVRVFAVSKA